MRVVTNVLNAEETFPYPVVTIGSFDGVHLGHLRILETVTARARAAEGTAAVLTMDPHPREFFAPERAPNLLTCMMKKTALLEEAGVNVVFVLPFDARTAAMTPQEFVEQVLCRRCGAKEVVVGHDFRFGKDASGDYGFLEEAAGRCGFSVAQVPPLFVNGERVSSTLIRERLLEGDLAGAMLFLGRPYSITGSVVAGRGIGSRLGFPTANIQPYHSAVPAHGVYVAEVLVNGGRWPAAVNIGIAPTIRHEDITIEAHLLNYSGDLIGSPIEVIFHKRLRPEKKFASPKELVEQIAADVAEVRVFCENFS
jgi:riboflavin kinase/FMN adenylyltransferase